MIKPVIFRPMPVPSMPLLIGRSYRSNQAFAYNPFQTMGSRLCVVIRSPRTAGVRAT